MTEGLGPAPETDEEREARAPHWIAPIVTWLASEESAERDRPRLRGVGPGARRRRGLGSRTVDRRRSTTRPQIGDAVAKLLADARPNSGMDGKPGSWPQTTLK